MKFRFDDRGQSIQVGAVLLFGILVLALSIYQTQGVPEENKQVEFDHSQQVADEMVKLYNAVFETVVDGEPQTAEITLGTEYNDGLFFIYPPPASGTLATTEDLPVRLENVSSTRDESFGSYWNNTTRSYDTQAITYEPDYRELRGTADYRIEHGIPAAQYPETTEVRLADNHEPIIDDEDPTDGVVDIELVVIDGDLRSVDTDAESVAPERVTESTEFTVENGTGTTGITLNLSTELTEDHWNTSDPEDILHDEDSVEEISVSDGAVELRLDDTNDYNLTVHKVDVGSDPAEVEPTYLGNRSYDDPELTFDIRDEFNDPVEDTEDVWVFNASGAVDRVETDAGVEKTVDLDGVDDPCGVSMAADVGSTEAYERINATGDC